MATNRATNITTNRATNITTNRATNRATNITTNRATNATKVGFVVSRQSPKSGRNPSESTTHLINPSLVKMPVSLKKTKKIFGREKKKKQTQTAENKAVYEFGALCYDFNDMYF